MKKRPTVRIEETEYDKILKHIKENKENITFQDYVMNLIRSDLKNTTHTHR